MRFCIVGSGRCGTSLLRRMLDMHPNVFVHRETHSLPKMYEYAGLTKCALGDLISILVRTTHANGAPVVSLDVPELERIFRHKPLLTVREFYDGISYYLAAKENKSIWADKTPDYGFFMQQIQTLWPNCKFLHLIRNGIAVASSMSKHPGFRWIVTANEATWCSASFNGYYTVIEAADHPLSSFVARWRHSIERIRDESTRVKENTYREIYYEELIGHPKDVLTKIADFVGIDATESWLNATADTVMKDKINFSYDQDVLETLDKRSVALLSELNYA
jgi:Sulfotransferase family